MTQQATLNARGSAILANVEFIDNGDIRPGWLSSDGTMVYSWGSCGSTSTVLKTSVDDGHTWQTVSTFPSLGGVQVHGVRETADGELLVSVFKTQGFYAGLWRSTGWTTNRATATWTEVLTPSGQAPVSADPATFPSPAGTTGDRSNYFTSWFGFHCYGNGHVVVNEYGKQANGTTIPGARYVFFSADNGKPGTWILIRDFWGGPPYTVPGNILQFGSATFRDHMHGAAYDPFANLFWFTGGDNGHHTEHADPLNANWPDPYNNHAVWQITPGCSPYITTLPGWPYLGLSSLPGQPGTTQCVTPWPLPDRVLLTTDGPFDGVVGYEKTGAQAGVTLAPHGIALPHAGNLSYTGATPFQRDVLSHAPGVPPRFPLLLPFYVGAGTSITHPAMIVACDPLGRRFYDIWTDNQSLANAYGCFSAIGPTASGKLLASLALDGRSAGQSAASGYTFMRADFPTII